MRIQTTIHVVSVCLPLFFAAGCKQGPSADTAPVATASAASNISAPLATQTAVESTPTTLAGLETNSACGGALDALASCAEAKTCDEDISLYLPAASRDALIALEGSSGYSAAAFDRYCLSACKTRSDHVDEKAFAENVCGAPAQPKSAAVLKTAMATAFLLHGKLSVSSDGVPLAQVIENFGEPVNKRTSRYECGSAFEEGAIQEYLYPDFALETDGDKAVVRSMQFAGGSRLTLADGQSFDAMDEVQFKKVFGSGVQRFADAYRTSASADGNLESAYDFHFDAAGKLKQVDFWIGC